MTGNIFLLRMYKSKPMIFIYKMAILSWLEQEQVLENHIFTNHLTDNLSLQAF